MGGLGQSFAHPWGSSPAPATSAWRLHCSRGQMGSGLWHWAEDSSHFSLEHCCVCPSKAPVLSHGWKQPAVPRGSRTASTAPAPPHPHSAQSAHGFFTLLMEKELKANSLHFLCSKRETGKKRKYQEQQVGAPGLWQTYPPVSELSPRASAAFQAVPNAPHCLAEGRVRCLHDRRDRANPAVTRGGMTSSQGMLPA